MEYREMLAHVDHTLLKAFATWEDIVTLCDDAVKYRTASVCVPSCYVKRIKEKYQDTLNICTVIGFPLGYVPTNVKVFEAKQAISDGADEIDTVINVTDVKNGLFDLVYEELKALRVATAGKILKVIIETCYLTEDEKIKLCEIVTRVKADYIKTSTGFGSGGATIEDVRLFKEHIGGGIKIKAAGGIRTLQAHEAFLNEGCDRLGSSSAVALIKEME